MRYGINCMTTRAGYLGKVRRYLGCSYFDARSNKQKYKLKWPSLVTIEYHTYGLSMANSMHAKLGFGLDLHMLRN